MVTDGRQVRSAIVYSQDFLHRPYGGVVPEIASREHIKNWVPVRHEAFRLAGVELDQIDVVAATRGPGWRPSPLMMAIGSLPPSMMAEHSRGLTLALGLVVVLPRRVLLFFTGLGWALVGKNGSRLRDVATGEKYHATYTIRQQWRPDDVFFRVLTEKMHIK